MHPSPSRSGPRALIAVVALAMLATSCGFGLSKRNAGPVVPSATIEVSYGDGLELDAPGSTGNTKLGTLKIRVYDDLGRPLPGVYVRYRGAEKKGKRVTDGKGIMRVNLPAGRYIVDLPPCGTTVMPDSPGEVDVVIVAGRTAEGNITEIPWRRRYYPTASVKLHSEPPWSRSEDVKMSVRIEDACRFSEAPGASVALYRWRLSSNFGLVRAPQRAGKDGFADVVVRCVKRGDGGVVIYDPTKRDVQVDLLAAVSDRPGPWCR